uniref:glycosyltransferase n=1 Tax=Gaiella sp. TaxID=2663207 RepID=UPI003983AAB1
DRPHILHTHTAKAGTIGRTAARLASKARPPVVVHTFHGHMLKGEFDAVRTHAFRAIERNLARSTDALVAVSPEVRDELVEVGVAPASKFVVVRLGIELSERMAGASGGASIRASLGIPPDRFCVGWVARMSAVKQPEDVLRTIRELRNRGVDAALIMIGDGPERVTLEARARELDLVEGVHFVGFQNDVGPWFHAFDVLLLTSRSEGTPVSAIETLASGRPVVATDVGGTRDVVSEGISGYLVPFGDVATAAERLERLALDPALRAQMGAAGQRFALASYSVPRLIDDIDRLYRSLLAGKGYSVAADGRNALPGE